MLYLLHFDTPLAHARHYLGYTRNGGLERRLAEHRAGNGARLMAVVQLAGITWELARTWPEGDRTLERRIKNQGGLSRFCPTCRATGSYHR